MDHMDGSLHIIWRKAYASYGGVHHMEEGLCIIWRKVYASYGGKSIHHIGGRSMHAYS